MDSTPKVGPEEPDALLDGLTELTPQALRERALAALRERRFDIVDRLLARGDLTEQALIENLRIYQAELEIQNDELISSQQRIQQGLARFTSFFNSLPIAELVIDRQGLIREANLAAQNLFELRAAHFVQHFFVRLIAEPDRALVVAAWQTLRSGRSVVLSDVQFNAGYRGPFTGDLHIAPIPGESSAEAQFVCAVLDRTDWVHQRESLLEASERLRRSDGDLRKRIAELETLHGILTETSAPASAVASVLQRIAERLPQAFRDPEMVEARIRVPAVTAATSAFFETAWNLSVPIPLAGGGLGDLTVAYRREPSDPDADLFLDGERQLLESVTTHLSVYLMRAHDEACLRESRERYRVVADFSSDWEYWLGVDGHFAYVSPACERVCGYSADDFLSDADLLNALILPDDRELWRTHLTALAADPWSGTTPLELRIRTKDGRERWIEHNCNPVRDAQGQFLGRRGVNRDITERKRFEEQLKRSEDFLTATGRMARVGGWEYDPAERRLRRTKDMVSVFGISLPEDADLETAFQLFNPKDRPVLRRAVEQALVFGEPFDLEARLASVERGEVWVQVTCEPFMQDDGVVKLLGAVQDITPRVEAAKSLRQAACVFESTGEGVIITDPRNRIVAVNRAFTSITGYEEREVLGESPKILRSGRHAEAFYRAMQAELGATGQWRGEVWNRHKDGHHYPALLTISAVRDISGELTHHVGVFNDITQIKLSEEKLQYLADHDSLTGLPNRSLFHQRLDQCLQRAKRYKRLAGLLFIDLDRFKEVNDTLGHAVGDALLVEVARLLADQVREVDTIARLGGDEFVVILEDIPAPRFAATFADRLMDLFSTPFQVLGRELFVTASIGISIYPDNGFDMETLVKHADIAMYEAKNGGRNGFSFYEKAMSDGAAERLRLEHDLRFALPRGELRVHYQPQLTADGARLRGVEALCRWMHPEHGLLAAQRFVPLAEDIGLIDELGFWVLEEGCRQLIAWDAQGLHVPRLAVNLSVREIERPGLVEQVASVLKRSGLAPERLELEVTESKIMRRADEAIGVLHALRQLGVTLAIDDFGTGYSSLSHLRRLPLNRLKIDGSFTDRVTQDHNDDAVVRAIIALARSLGLEVLAEGVETRAQADFLSSEGCSESQGHLYSEPLAPETLFARWCSQADAAARG